MALGLKILAKLGAALSAPLLIAAAPVEYTVTPEPGAQGLDSLAVTVRLQGDADGSTDLALPGSWAGVDRLYEAVDGLTVEGGTVAPVTDPGFRTVAHKPGAALVARYRVRSAATADPDLDYRKARPVLRPGWFYVHGEGALLVPAGRGQEPATFRWGPTPRNPSVCTSASGL